MEGQVKSLQSALKESLDHQSRLLLENESEIAFTQGCADSLREAREQLARTLNQLGFTVEDKVSGDSSIKVESEAFIMLMSSFVEIQTRQRDRDGLPLVWVGAMSTLEETLMEFLEFSYGHLTVKEVGLTVSTAA